MRYYKKHIIIVGTARSGTSWLSETIASQYRYRMLFEPEHETRTKHGYLICDQWLTVSAHTKSAQNYLKRVFANRVDSDWIAQNSNRTFKRHLWPWIPKKYIIKFVRANLAAKYMNEVFNIPVIHVIRNPYDVIKSQLRSNFPWLTDLTIYARQDDLVTLIKNHFNLDITDFKNKSKIEILCIRWCIENVIPLELLEPYQGEALVIKYEDLISDIRFFYDLCSQFQLDPISSLEEFYTKPSSKTHKNSMIRTQKQQEFVWGDLELQQINSVLDMFKSKLYPRKIN
uniref:sulfotransferase domain-containing protein n=1 Tax=Gelidibacter sp. TaxID=2018083 RepID=UPI00404A9752